MPRFPGHASDPRFRTFSPFLSKVGLRGQGVVEEGHIRGSLVVAERLNRTTLSAVIENPGMVTIGDTVEVESVRVMGQKTMLVRVIRVVKPMSMKRKEAAEYSRRQLEGQARGNAEAALAREFGLTSQWGLYPYLEKEGLSKAEIETLLEPYLRSAIAALEYKENK